MFLFFLLVVSAVLLAVSFHLEPHITKLIAAYYKIISSLHTKGVFFDPESFRPLISLYFLLSRV